MSYTDRIQFSRFDFVLLSLSSYVFIFFVFSFPYLPYFHFTFVTFDDFLCLTVPVRRVCFSFAFLCREVQLTGKGYPQGVWSFFGLYKGQW